MTACSLYRHFDADGALLYVGISQRPVLRLAEHARASGWRGEIAVVRLQHFDTRAEAEAAEREAIASEAPLWNGSKVELVVRRRGVMPAMASILQRRGLTQQQAADEIGIPIKTFQRIYRREHFGTERVWCRIIEWSGGAVHPLCFFAEEMASAAGGDRQFDSSIPSSCSGAVNHVQDWDSEGNRNKVPHSEAST